MRRPQFLYGTATGIGSLPHTGAEAALRLIFTHFPDAPHWPQLPARGRAEGFVRQSLYALEKLGMLQINESPPFFCDMDDDWPVKLERFYNLCLQTEEEMDGALSFFAFPEETAEGFYSFLDKRSQLAGDAPLRYIKGQISGPLSLGLQLTGGDQTAAFYRHELREIITRNLTMLARWQVRTLKRFSCPVLVFVDEPALLSFGQSTYISLSREHIQESLREVIRAITAEGAYAGVHCCSGVDWSILFELPLHVVNFDAYSHFPSLLVYSEELQAFLQRGGCLGWGLVPTAPEIEIEDCGRLWQIFARDIDRLCKKGVAEGLLREQYMLTPSCGAAVLTVPQAEKVYRLTAELRERLAGK
ncbi:MAG TPA: hypothetical protein DCQ14_04375 [Firmicutes bacterium]|nr:hypothetical protein [Bacillota bacterium]